MIKYRSWVSRKKRVKIEITFQNNVPDLRPGHEMIVKIIADSPGNAHFSRQCYNGVGR